MVSLPKVAAYLAHLAPREHHTAHLITLLAALLACFHGLQKIPSHCALICRGHTYFTNLQQYMFYISSIRSAIPTYAVPHHAWAYLEALLTATSHRNADYISAITALARYSSSITGFGSTGTWDATSKLQRCWNTDTAVRHTVLIVRYRWSLLLVQCHFHCMTILSSCAACHAFPNCCHYRVVMSSHNGYISQLYYCPRHLSTVVMHWTEQMTFCIHNLINGCV